MGKTIQTTRINSLIILLVALISGNCCFGQNADINLLKDINLHRNKSLDGSMTALTNSVYPIAAVIPITELIAGYHRHDTALICTGWSTIAGIGMNFIVTFGLKFAVDRPRPYATYPELQPYQHDKDPSFPSGHSSFAFNTATSLVLNYPRWYVAVPAYGWAAAVAYSRMDLGMHYPTDVLAGSLIGAGTSILAYKGNQWLHKRKTRHHVH